MIASVPGFAPRSGLVALGALTVAVVTALVVIRPFQAGAVEYDSAASVLYFDRIMTGRHLEATLLATPKPFLTVVFGSLYAVFHDWRVLVWATIAAYGLGIPRRPRSWRVASRALEPPLSSR